MEHYLKQFYDEEITNLLNDANDSVHVSINVSLTNLQRHQPRLFATLIADPRPQLRHWNAALLAAQKQLLEGNAFLAADFQIKENCHVRFVQLPAADPRAHLRCFPNHDQVGRFVQVKGNVVRMTQAKLLECRREYVCGKCRTERLVEAEYVKMFVIDAPRGCGVAAREGGDVGCRGTMYPKRAQPAAEHCVDFQEIRIQELISHKNMPASLVVTLDDDLVDSCQPGDCITVCGTMERRWRPLAPGKRAEVILCLRALSVYREEKRSVTARDLPEHLLCVRADWQESVERWGETSIRDELVRSFCPEVHGMYLVKLAILLALGSGVNPKGGRPTGGSETRGNSHLILVGDPGLAKSRLLKFAASVAVRAVHTTGMGCSAAGLTAAAIKEDGEWQLEAGALVLADGGLCCIDEFNLMRESDKASIHEAMEQQTISMAKAGLVCKLSTRCIVLAATNPKNLSAMYESDGMAALNIGIASPLLSRFDIVLILRDERNPEWDDQVADHVLNHKPDGGGQPTTPSSLEHWSITKMQTHFMAIRDIHPSLSREANLVLGSYYKACRAHLARDPARTSVRLLDSLVRLAQAHARLMFRNEVTELDAVLVVRLMESSWGFGKLLVPQNILKARLPIGPNAEQVDEVKAKLQLDYVSEESTRETRRLVGEQLDTQREVRISIEVNDISPDDQSSAITLGTSVGLSEEVVPSVGQVVQTKSLDLFQLEEETEEEFSQVSLLTNRSFESVLRGRHDTQASSSTSQGLPTQNRLSSHSIRSNLNSLASLFEVGSSSTARSTQPTNTIQPLVRGASSIFASQTLDEDHLDDILSLDDLPGTAKNSSGTVVPKTTSPRTVNLSPRNYSSQANRSLTQTQPIPLTAIGENLDAWVDFEDEEDDHDSHHDAHQDLTADLEMEFSQGFGEDYPEPDQTPVRNTPQLTELSDLPKFQFKKLKMDSKPSTSNRVEALSGEGSSVSMRELLPNPHTLSPKNGSSARENTKNQSIFARKSQDFQLSKAEPVCSSQENAIRKETSKRIPLKEFKTPDAIIDQIGNSDNGETSKPNPTSSDRSLSTKTLNRLNLFCKPSKAPPPETDSPSPVGTPNHKQNAASDSAYDSMLVPANTSLPSTTTTATISQLSGRKSFLCTRDDTEDLSFLDDLDM